MTAVTGAPAIPIARAANRKTTGPPAPSFAVGSHVELGRALADRLKAKSDRPPVHDEGDFNVYDPSSGLWVKSQRSELETIVHDFDAAFCTATEKPIILKQSDINGALKCAAAEMAMVDFFSGARAGLVFSNGFLEVDSQGARLLPHSHEYRARCALPFAYEPNASRPLFDPFMRGLFRDDADADAKIALLQEHAGASLLGIATRYQQVLVLVGGGENGKSAYVLIIVEIFPVGTVQAIPIHDFGQEYRRALLAGCRLNAVAELPEAEIKNTEAFKAIAVGDPILGRRIFEGPFTFRPRAGHVFGANALPGSADATHGFWRRLIPITFNRNFVGDRERDPEIAEKIIASELPAIVAWAVEGGVRLMKRGRYLLPPSSIEALDQWRQGANQAVIFAGECLVSDPKAVTRSADLYRHYDYWARFNGFRPLDSNELGKRLEKHGFVRGRTSECRGWRLQLVRGEGWPVTPK